jgi:hypothetical protein
MAAVERRYIKAITSNRERSDPSPGGSGPVVATVEPESRHGCPHRGGRPLYPDESSIGLSITEQLPHQQERPHLEGCGCVVQVIW